MVRKVVLEQHRVVWAEPLTCPVDRFLSSLHELDCWTRYDPRPTAQKRRPVGPADDDDVAHDPGRGLGERGVLGGLGVSQLYHSGRYKHPPSSSCLRGQYIERMARARRVGIEGVVEHEVTALSP